MQAVQHRRMSMPVTIIRAGGRHPRRHMLKNSYVTLDQLSMYVRRMKTASFGFDFNSNVELLLMLSYNISQVVGRPTKQYDFGGELFII